MENDINLFVAVGLKEGIAPDDVRFAIYETGKQNCFFVMQTEGFTKLIDAENIHIISQKREEIDFDAYDFILEIKIPLMKNVQKKDTSFTIALDEKNNDGFEIQANVLKQENISRPIILSEEVYITRKYIKQGKPRKNKAFAFSFPGEYLRGNGYVVAPDLKTAYEMAKAEVDSKGFSGKFKLEDVWEIDLNKSEAVVQYDGQLS